ncbi:hypothetical protein FFONT_0892 [Fervidicoccus fontis Kam940]|uniref:Uncharacterized protein n=2 Tax=Fervidicoccaceae TaxID=685949 RepID=I0A1M3_FERFK|nr:hypothetical protein FFONT_0892 [Fervidicoccus fontis Kam940]
MGIILLSIGIILLLFSFILAYNSFTNYTLAIPSNYSDLSSAIINSSYELIILAAKIAFLGIMVWISGIFIKYGVDAFRLEKFSQSSEK